MRRSVSPLGCRGKGDKGDYRPCVRPADGRRDAQAAAPVVIRVSVRSVLVRERACKYTSTRVLVLVCVCVWMSWAVLMADNRMMSVSILKSLFQLFVRCERARRCALRGFDRCDWVIIGPSHARYKCNYSMIV